MSAALMKATGLTKLPSQRGAHAVISIVGVGPVVHQSNRHVASLVHTFHDPVGDKARREATAIGTIKKELTRLKPIRTSLGQLRRKMLACHRVNATEFRKKLWPREHLWEAEDVFTLTDLVEIGNFCDGGRQQALKLRDLLVTLVYQCQQHIKACKCKTCARAHAHSTEHRV